MNYGEVNEMIVRAKNEYSARITAAKCLSRVHNKEKDRWLDKKMVACDKVIACGAAKVITMNVLEM